MVTAIGSSFYNANNTGTSALQDAFQLNSSQYLQLLLTTMKYQDFENPMDATQLQEQTSMLTNTQTLLDVSNSIKALTSAQANNNASSLSTFLDKEIFYEGSDFYRFNSAAETEINFDASKENSEASILIYSADGQLVHRDTVKSLKIGENTYTWSGLDKNGQLVPAGNYKILVSSQDSKGSYAGLNTRVSGLVTGVDFSSGIDPVLSVGYGDNKIEINVADIAKVNSINNFTAY